MSRVQPAKVAPADARGAAEDGVTRLTVEVSASGDNPWIASAWRARVRLADATVREFSSPFELARFLAQPISGSGRRGRQGRRPIA